MPCGMHQRYFSLFVLDKEKAAPYRGGSIMPQLTSFQSMIINASSMKLSLHRGRKTFDQSVSIGSLPRQQLCSER